MRSFTSCAVIAALPWALVAREASADSASNETTLGHIVANKTQPGVGIFTDRANANVSIVEQLSLRLGATYTRYGHSAGVSAENIFQFLAGGSWEPLDHYAFDFYGTISPTSTLTTEIAAPTGGTEALRVKTSSFGFGLGAEYDTMDPNRDEPRTLESVAGVSFGAQSYSTTQRAKSALLAPTTSIASLWQWRMALDLVETVKQDTDLGLLVSYYLYSPDPMDSGYYGEAVFGRAGATDGLPLLPLRYALRPSAAQRIGPVSIGASFQYGHYIDSLGTSVIGSLRVQYKVMRELKVWLGGNLQRDVEGSNDPVNVRSASLGVRLRF